MWFRHYISWSICITVCTKVTAFRTPVTIGEHEWTQENTETQVNISELKQKHGWTAVNASGTRGENKWNHWIQKNVFLIELVMYCFIEMIDWHWHPIASRPISVEVVGSSPTRANFLYLKYPIRKLWKNLKNLKKKIRKICHIRKNYQVFDMIGNLEED